MSTFIAAATSTLMLGTQRARIQTLLAPVGADSAVAGSDSRGRAQERQRLNLVRHRR
jgi:hypothetical protein